MLDIRPSSDANPQVPRPESADPGGRGSDEVTAARAAKRLQMLQELAEIGMDLARAVHRQALAEAPAIEAGEGAVAHPPAGGDLGLVFSRIARAVRQTLALEARLEQERSARDRAAGQGPGRQGVEAKWRARRRRQEVSSFVEQLIEAESDRDDVEHLLADLAERLDDDEDAGALADRPIGELIAGICRDLGLTPDWSLWADEDWAAQAVTAGTPGPRPAGSGPPPGAGPAEAPGQAVAVPGEWKPP